MRKRSVLLALTALGLAFAPSCGDDGDPAETGTTTTTAPVGEATTTTEEAAAPAEVTTLDVTVT